MEREEIVAELKRRRDRCKEYKGESKMFNMGLVMAYNDAIALIENDPVVYG